MKIAGAGIDASLKITNAQKGIKTLNKVLNCKTKYRWFFRIFRNADHSPTVLSVSYPVRALDDRLKCGSLFALGDNWEIDEKNNRYIDLNGLTPYQRIARVLHKAECEAEKERVEKNAIRDAEDAGTDPNSPAQIASRAIAVNNVELKYFGSQGEGPYTAATVKPLIGGIKNGTFTELYVVPLTSNDIPEWSKAELVAWDVTSSTKVSKLKEIFTNGVDDDAKFIEVQVNYGMNTDDKSEASRALTLTPVSKDNALSTLFPAEWEKFKSKLEDIADDVEVMANRSAGATYSKSANLIIESIKKYVSTHPNILNKIDVESADVKNVAKDMVDTGILDSNASVKDKLLSLVGTITTEEESAITEQQVAEEKVDYNIEQVTNAQSIDELVNAVESSSSTGDLSALGSEDIDAI